MVLPGLDGLDTPRTNVGDATYLKQPDFDMTQEPSFQSPSKDNNIFQTIQNGGRPNLRTPRGGRGALGERRNLPAGLGGAEFTPMLKSATRNSARRYRGKENGLATPAFLDKINEDMTPVPDISSFGASRNGSSFMDATPLPQVESSSAASTPLVMRTRVDGKGPLQDGNQLSLREQENVIDRIEKENFGLKLKIHFLEEALRKAGPGFSEAALKENTDLKVDKVTMQRELQRYKKHLTTAEKELEGYRQQILEMQDKAKRKYLDENQRAELERLRQELEDKEADIEDLQRQVDGDQQDNDRLEKLQDDIADLEAEIREKDRIISEHEDELDDLRAKADSAEDRMKDAQRRIIELEEQARSSEQLDEAKDTIEDLEANIRDLEQQLDSMKDKLEEAVSEKDRAENDLEELQEEMANKSVVTKGLSRQVEEKVSRLQNELDNVRQENSELGQQLELKRKENDDLRNKVKDARQERDTADRERRVQAAKLEEAQNELHTVLDQKALLQTRHDALTNESASLQRDVSKLQRTVAQLEDDLEREKQHALNIERDIRSQYKTEIDRLNDDISDLQAEVREKENLYDNDSEKWETERHNLESERDRAEERAAGLQRTIERLRETEGTLSSKETKLQEAIQSETERHRSEEAILGRQIADLQQDLEGRQVLLESLRSELSTVRDELRQTGLDYHAQTKKVESLEDELDVLQAALDESEKGGRDSISIKQECDDLRRKLAAAEAATKDVRVSSSATQESARHSNELADKLKSQLTESTSNLSKVTKEKQALQDQLANLNIELHSLRTSVAETQAERDEIEGQLRRFKAQGEDTYKLDQERIDLRTAKMKLDNEVRRLRDENRSLVDQRQGLEKSLEDEIEKAAAEEERLGLEIQQLQAKLRQHSESQDLATARRTIRELERRIQDLEAQLAATQTLPNLNIGDSSELSLMRRDLSEARQKERDYLQREASHKETIKTLKRQITDLERAAHQAEIDRLIASPRSDSSSARKSEVSELRHQLSTAHQSLNEFKKLLRESERKAASKERELQTRLEEIDDERMALEQALDDAEAVAAEAAETHIQELARLQSKTDKYKRERDQYAAELAAAQQNNYTGGSSNGGGSEVSKEERRDLHAMLRKTQVEADGLEREVREVRDALAEVTRAEEALRKKLDRARSERAMYRADAERLERQVKSLQVEQAEEAAALAAADVSDVTPTTGAAAVDADALVRASEQQQQRHRRELRAMCMQAEWLQARWEREHKLRSDAAFAKRYLLLELSVRDACNKADLAALKKILVELGVENFPPPASPATLPGSNNSNSNKRSSSSAAAATIIGAGARRAATNTISSPALRRLAIVLRFVARARLAAGRWATHQASRQRLVAAATEERKEARLARLRGEWLAGRKGAASSSSSPPSPPPIVPARERVPSGGSGAAAASKRRSGGARA
ncbi:uncharacterized protein E0L32_000960 [Thyridium curvatum]|uniref:Uncharacterized protein n=1 Tax=Thyridium curvatum TaxID=1093900 RepID=A0A507AYS2_9PEZI|nr:uncharacterized protein E0L32_000960 [Thyridium curvatum]TPX12783.1 hypothetical protein E0L32_000960 [Thyridium curvatum]